MRREFCNVCHARRKRGTIESTSFHAMVAVGAFALQVVDADTGIPLKELVDQKDGQVWVEGSEGVQYFLQISHTRNPGYDTKCIVDVDGINLSKHHKRATDLHWSKNLGIKKKGQDVAVGAEGISHALKFQRIGQVAAADGAEDEDGRPPACGMIVARWHRTTDLGPARGGMKVRDNKWQGGASHAAAADNKKEGAAALKSTAGSAPSTFRTASRRTATHEEVGRITIRYTSDFGLAVRGLLKDDEQDAAAAGALPKAKRPKRAEAEGHRPAAAAGSSSSAAGSSSSAGGSSTAAGCSSSTAHSSKAAVTVTVFDDDEDEQKVAVRSARGFTDGEVVDLLNDSD